MKKIQPRACEAVYNNNKLKGNFYARQLGYMQSPAHIYVCNADRITIVSLRFKQE